MTKYDNQYFKSVKEEDLPVRWMAPKSLDDGIFSHPSDVWLV